MSMQFLKHGVPETLEYDDGMTKQEFKDDADINKIIARFGVQGAATHLQKHGFEYGDFAEFDFLEAQMRLARGKEIFAELPGEVRREFNQSPAEFFAFVNDPENVDRLPDLLPDLAQPGNYNLDMRSSTPPGATTEPQSGDVGGPAPESPAPGDSGGEAAS